MPAAQCYHCGLLVAEPGRWRAPLLGAPRDFCCAGCEAVAGTIAAAGFERYYETRSAAGTAPAELAPAEELDDPQAQAQFVAATGEHGREASLILDRIRCAACLWLVEQWLRRQPGILRASVNYATRRAHVAWDARSTKLSQLVAAVRAIGYDAYPWDPQRQGAMERGERRKALWRLFVAGFGAMQVMMYAFPAYLDDGGTLPRDVEALFRWASLLLTLPVLLFSCTPFFAAAWQDARHRRISLDTPIALGIAAGFGASAWATLAGSGAVYFDSIAMLVFLLLGARYLELGARQRAARSLDRLARWMPSFALRLAGEAPHKVAVHLLAPGDRVLVPAGERVPADGVVERGASSADESLLTGEARPVRKAAGARLVGGSVNLEQPLVLRVMRVGAETQAAAIGRLVERAAAARPRAVAGADRIARSLTWLVLAVAAAAGLYWQDPWVAIAVLVATCPCALALATPVTLTAASARLLSLGMALTRARALEALERATDVVLDKTGTLTEGRFALARTVPLGALDAQACLQLAGALESASRHPLARAFGGAATAAAVDPLSCPGRGMEGRIDGRRLRIGSESFCRELCEVAPPRAFVPPDASHTPVFLACSTGWLAAFLLTDRLRPEARGLVAGLRNAGLHVHLVSGDQPAVVEACARRLGIECFAGAVAPEGKLEYIARLQGEGRVVLMIGDGLNDAPVLARADVSIAMGGGADAAQLQADLVLTGDSLRGVVAAMRLARRTMRIVRQNFGWALAYNALALPAAAAGWIGPWEAALGMAASSFIVVLNAGRISAPARDQRPWKASTSSYRSQSA